jgi:cyclophilin family peptidyl-prolyl cis-trans isomerase
MKQLRIIASLLLTGILVLVSACSAGTSKTTKWSAAPAMTIDQNKTYTATIKTNYGDMVVELLAKEAPLTVNNFVFLANNKFYDGVKFHRVFDDSFIQGGDPLGTGNGDPGYTFKDELPTTRDYTPGAVAMANSGANTNGSQFFICIADMSGRFAKNYSIFGYMVSGLDVAKEISRVPTTFNSMGENAKPTVDVHIVTVKIQVS